MTELTPLDPQQHTPDAPVTDSARVVGSSPAIVPVDDAFYETTMDKMFIIRRRWPPCAPKFFLVPVSYQVWEFWHTKSIGRYRFKVDNKVQLELTLTKLGLPPRSHYRVCLRTLHEKLASYSCRGSEKVVDWCYTTNIILSEVTVLNV